MDCSSNTDSKFRPIAMAYTYRETPRKRKSWGLVWSRVGFYLTMLVGIASIASIMKRTGPSFLEKQPSQPQVSSKSTMIGGFTLPILPRKVSKSKSISGSEDFHTSSSPSNLDQDSLREDSTTSGSPLESWYILSLRGGSTNPGGTLGGDSGAGSGGGGIGAGRKEMFKQGLDENTARRQREDHAIGLRKNKREERMNKRRFILTHNLNQSTQGQGPDEGLPASVGGIPGANAIPPPTLNDLPQLVISLKSESLYERFKGAQGLRKLLSVESPPATAAVEVGALAPLVALLSHKSSTELQFEAAWALTNIASTDYTRQVVQAGAVPPLVELLSSASADVREQGAWCLGNIAGDCPELRNLVLDAKALDPILANIQQPASLSLLRNTVWTLSNLCRGKPPVHLEVAKKVVPLLASIVRQCSDEDTLIDACWAFSYITDGENERIDILLEHRDVIVGLVKHLGSRSATLVAPALRTLGNVVTGNDGQTQAVLDAGILPQLLTLLQHPKKSLRKETCWLISNIAAGDRKQISMLLAEPRLIPEVLQHLSWGQWEVREEAAWAISNLCMSKNHVQKVVEMGAIRPLCELLTASDPNLVIVVLNAIESILQVSEEQGLDYDERLEDADGLDKLEELQGHKNEEIYLKAVGILERYFPGEEDVGED